MMSAPTFCRGIADGRNPDDLTWKYDTFQYMQGFVDQILTGDESGGGMCSHVLTEILLFLLSKPSYIPLKALSWQNAAESRTFLAKL